MKNCEQEQGYNWVALSWIVQATPPNASYGTSTHKIKYLWYTYIPTCHLQQIQAPDSAEASVVVIETDLEPRLVIKTLLVLLNTS